MAIDYYCRTVRRPGWIDFRAIDAVGRFVTERISTIAIAVE